MKHPAILLLSLLMAMPAALHAQKKLVDKREQASGWYVPVTFRVTAHRGKAKPVLVQVYKDNKLIHAIPGSSDKFTLNLDLDNDYTVVIGKEGYRSKSVSMDTRVPGDLVQYPAYECAIDLEPAGLFTNSDPFYADFPSALVRWDDGAKGFFPHPGYLVDIQSKMAMLQVQMDPR